MSSQSALLYTTSKSDFKTASERRLPKYSIDDSIKNLLS